MVDVTGEQDRPSARVTDPVPEPPTATPAGGWGRAALRRWPTVAGIAILLLLLAFDAVQDFAEGLLWAAVLYVMIGALRGHLRRIRLLAVQVGGVLVFGGLGVLAAVLDRPWAAYLLAFGWLAHAAWDAAHLWAKAVVPRWYAESCAVLDVLLVVTILVLA